MPTTSNFGWTTPADTDLVKDGAAAIRTLGNGIDTSLVDLKGGTTGQVLSKASNTDLDFTWVAQDDSNAIQNALLTTTGDTIYASGASTPARLGLGTAGQVLTVNSGATAPEWATPSSGGMTLISTTTLSGATTTLSSIPQTYNHLIIIVTGMTANTSNKGFRGLPNGSASISDYTWIKYNNTPSSKTSTFLDLYGGNSLRTDANNSCFIRIDNYTSTTSYKPINFYSRYLDADGTTKIGILAGGAISTNSAITSFAFDYEGTNTFAGGTVLLYGVK